MDQDTKTYLDDQFGYFREKFGEIDAHFEQIDKRFEQVDQRFEQVDARFEQIDARFDSMRKYIDYRFDELPKIFVTKADFEELSSKMYEYLDAFAGVVEESGQDREKYAHRFSATDDKIHDHEVRIRTLETKK